MSADNGVQINTNTTSGGNATVERAGVQLSFAAKSSFQVKLRVTSSTNLTRCRVGIGAELASETNITNIRKYGIEGCSSSGVNWLVFSATATNRTTLSSASPVATAGPYVLQGNKQFIRCYLQGWRCKRGRKNHRPAH